MVARLLKQRGKNLKPIQKLIDWKWKRFGEYVNWNGYKFCFLKVYVTGFYIYIIMQKRGGENSRKKERIH